MADVTSKIKVAHEWAFVAIIVATVILVFFGIGYGLGRIFL